MQGYNFRGIDDMYNALNPLLAAAKIFFAPEIISTEREERATKNWGVLIYTVLTMRFTAYAEDGSSVSTITIGEAMDSWDKSANKAMSTAYKYALMQIFCIPTIEEKDTEYQTHEVVPKQQYQEETKAWFNEKELKEMTEALEQWEVFSKSAIKQDYAISKTMGAKIQEVIAKYPSQFIA